MKKLVIAEKPSVGRDIARVLGCKQQGKKYIEGNEYIVTWGLGHLVTLADPEGYDKKLKTWRMADRGRTANTPRGPRAADPLRASPTAATPSPAPRPKSL